MNKNFEVINSVYKVDKDLLEHNKDDVDKIIKKELAKSIAKLISSKLESLPVSYIEEEEHSSSIKCKLSFVIVDEDEVKRLVRSGELKYYK